METIFRRIEPKGWILETHPNHKILRQNGFQAFVRKKGK